MWPGDSKAQAGTTLVELMISSALLLLILASCGVALRAAVQYYRRVTDMTAMENSLIVVSSLLSKDLAESARLKVVYDDGSSSSGGPSVTFPVPRGSQGELLVDHAAGNHLKFGTILSYRVVGSDQELRRYVDVLPSPLDLAPDPIGDLSPPRNASYFAPSKHYRPLALHVTTFDLVGIEMDDNGVEKGTTTDMDYARALKVTLEIKKEMNQVYGVSYSLLIHAAN